MEFIMFILFLKMVGHIVALKMIKTEDYNIFSCNSQLDAQTRSKK